MPKEQGEPNVDIAITASGIRLRLAAVFVGDGTDWENETAGTWMLEMWARALTLAKMHHDYGIRVEIPTAPDLDIFPLVKPPFAIPEQSPPPSERARAQAERERLNQLIQARVEDGVTPPTGNHRKPQQRVVGARGSELEEQILTVLATAGGAMARPDLFSKFPHLSPASVNYRVQALLKERQIKWEQRKGWLRTGGYVLQPVDREAETQEGDQRHNHLAELLPFTRGRVFLMLGGDSTPERVHTLQATLQLKELRWPTFYEEQPLELRLREIRRPDVDLVILNRWSRRYSKNYQHEAHEWEKPVVVLTRGINVAQVVEQLRRQWLSRRGPSAERSMVAA